MSLFLKSMHGLLIGAIKPNKLLKTFTICGFVEIDLCLFFLDEYLIYGTLKPYKIDRFLLKTDRFDKRKYPLGIRCPVISI